MLIRGFYKLIIFLGPLIVFWYMLFVYFDGESYVEKWSEGLINHEESIPTTIQEQEPASDEPSTTTHDGDETEVYDDPAVAEIQPPSTQELLPPAPFPLDENGDIIVDYSVYREVFSVSTANRKYFAVDFGVDFPAVNPNIIPHPTEDDTWIIVAQKQKEGDPIFEELVCNAVFALDGTLACKTPPATLPVQPTFTDKCQGEKSHFGISKGPHDMRVFWGPEAPFAIYGSQSAYACFGLWTQDFRGLVNDFGLESLTSNLFSAQTEIQRPLPWHEVEKNWFMFWDTDGNTYVHHDVEPKRVFAQISPDGAVGPDLAPFAAATDDACMAKFMPRPNPPNENLHQATNSLSITLCNRADPNCQPTPENTFVLSIFQHKSFHGWHGVYEPYVMLFQQNAPFALHAITTKPIWIHGRAPLTKENAGGPWKEEGMEPPTDHTQMFYVTSVSWKAKGMRWHGFLDDVLLIGFGVEDETAAAIDVLAGDLLQDLGKCTDV